MKIIHLFSEVIMMEVKNQDEYKFSILERWSIHLETSPNEWNGVLITPVSYLQT